MAYRTENIHKLIDKISKMPQREDSTRLLQELLDFLLRMSAKEGYSELIRPLILAGANPADSNHNNLAMKYAVRYKHVDIVVQLVECGAPIEDYFLVQAVKNSDEAMCMLLIMAGINVFYHHKEALRVAKEIGNSTIIAMIEKAIARN